MSSAEAMARSRSGVGRTLRDPAAQAQLEEQGYAVVDLLGPEQVAQLAEIADRLLTHQRTGFHASNITGSAAYRRAVDAEVRPLVESAVEAARLMVDHEAYTSSLLVKWPGEDSAFHTHQDWNMVDEARFRTVNVWCPLVDTDEGNGALAVLPGSHRYLEAIRCSPMPPESHRSPGWGVSYADMVKVPARAGQAIVFDHALLHSSPPNLTPTWRPAVAAAFKPRGASLQHWYLPDRDRLDLEVFEIDSTFFTDFVIGDRPDYPVVGSATFRSDSLTTEALMKRCGVRVVRTEAVSAPVEPEASPERHPEPSTPPEATAGQPGEAVEGLSPELEALLRSQPAFKRTKAWRFLRRFRARTEARWARRR